jgi:NADPH:quinone reductase-like Zn-dependent oxidoreductase
MAGVEGTRRERKSTKEDAMKAVVYEKYGPPDVLQLREVEEPTIEDNEVLVRVRATTVSPMDWRFRNPKSIIARYISGLTKPKTNVLGQELAGEIASVGKDVTLFKEGDEVYGATRGGAHAEYISLSEEAVVKKPANMSYEEAAAVPFGGFTALRFLRRGGIQSGQEVLINGASGGVGTLAVQLAKHFGTKVTGVCSTTNLELVQSLGADKVIDYTAEDFTRSGQTYDIIFDAVGKNSFSNCRGSLNQAGIYLSTEATLPLLLQMLWTSKTGSEKAMFMLAEGTATEDREDLLFLKDLIEAGEVRSVIDRSYPLSEIAEAHKYAEQGHVKGKVVITV